ncbi:MAG TPA: hypothetical protein VIA81_10580 [Acidimicrobiia bacterium]|jgi:hypothetical protein
MVGLIRAELIKLFKRRTFYVLVIVLGLLTALLAAIFFLLPRALPDEADFPVFTKPGAYLFGAAQVLGQTWFPLILSTMYLAGELSTSAWGTTLTRHAKRWQHLIARLLTTTGASWLAMLAAIGGFSLIALFLATGSGSLEAGEWFGIVWKALLVVFTWVALGMAASAWLRGVGPAIGATLAFSFAEGILAIWDVWRNISLSIHTTALLGSLELGGFGGLLGDTPSFGKALAVVLGWCVVAIAAAWAGLQLRDA